MPWRSLVWATGTMACLWSTRQRAPRHASRRAWRRTQVLDLVAERVDLAVRFGAALADSTMIAQPLVRTRYRVCASAAKRTRGHTDLSVGCRGFACGRDSL